MADAGFRVTVVARDSGSEPSAIPKGVTFVELAAGGGLVQRLEAWRALIDEHEIDVVIDHQMLYTRYWPEFAAMARGRGAATVGWLHNFVGRPLLDGDDRLAIIDRNSAVLAHVVALSPLDVAYLKLRDIAHVSYVPNPPSAMLTAAEGSRLPKRRGSGPLRLVWWGRLEERTKRVSELIEVAVALQRLDVAFKLTVIGPDWGDLTARKFNALAKRVGVGTEVRAIGPRRGDALLAEIDDADAFVSTSIIEGYQLTIAEAQSRGLPVFMYELPWLTLVQNNDGIVSAPQGDAAGLAASIARIAADPNAFGLLSNASLRASARASEFDFSDLYRRVVTGTVLPAYSPAPTLHDAGQLLGLLRFYAETSPETPKRHLKADSWFGSRAWSAAAPAGRRALQRFPGLRPLAHRLKQRMGAGG